jgi:threonine/homoserine/homoserine lactone efflux protein
LTDIITFAITGIVFGLTAGISPGPLLTVVITETLTHSRKEGIKVAIAPLLTDIPIILVCIFILSRLNDYDSILGIISLLGGLFIIYLGVESFKARDIEIDANTIKPKSIRKGIVVNILSPHPYLFWITVGAPILFRSFNISLGTSLVFIVSFYTFLVGSKVLIAILVHKSRDYLKNKNYRWIMRILGLVLLVFAVIFIRDGLKLFGIL